MVPISTNPLPFSSFPNQVVSKVYDKREHFPSKFCKTKRPELLDPSYKMT